MYVNVCFANIPVKILKHNEQDANKHWLHCMPTHASVATSFHAGECMRLCICVCVRITTAGTTEITNPQKREQQTLHTSFHSSCQWIYSESITFQSSYYIRVLYTYIHISWIPTTTACVCDFGIGFECMTLFSDIYDGKVIRIETFKLLLCDV